MKSNDYFRFLPIIITKSFLSFRHDIFIQLAKKLKAQAEKEDLELSQEKEKNVQNIVNAVTSKSKSSRPKRNSGKEKDSSKNMPCSEYLEMVKNKRMRNKTKLQDLGLLNKTPTPKRRKLNNKNSSPKEHKKSPAARRKLMSPKKAVAIESTAESVVEKFPYNHTCFSTSYNEEKDKRYLDKRFDLFGVKCQGCGKCFTKIDKKNTLTPTNAAPMYVCRSRC